MIYNDKYGLDYDASQIDPVWFRWIHYMTDKPPTVEPPVNHKWIEKNPGENNTFNANRYMPYPTAQPKVEAWIPKSPNNNSSSK